MHIRILFVLVLLAVSCVSKKKYEEVITLADKLRTDSMLLEKRVHLLTDEKNYLSQKCATIEQAYTQRLQEKEDSLAVKEKVLIDREYSLRDMKSRKEQEKEAFETLAKSITGYFQHDDANDVRTGFNCSDIVVEISDRMLFVPGTIKPDPKAEVIYARINTIFNKNKDVKLIVVAHTDSVNHTKEKVETMLQLGALKSTALVRSLLAFGVEEQRVLAASKGSATRLNSRNKPLGRNRIELIFYSELLPCVK